MHHFDQNLQKYSAMQFQLGYNHIIVLRKSLILLTNYLIIQDERELNLKSTNSKFCLSSKFWVDGQIEH